MELPIIAYSYLVFSFFICFSFQNQCGAEETQPSEYIYCKFRKQADWETVVRIILIMLVV